MKNNTLVIGASENVQRYSYMAINKLLDNGYKVYAIGKTGGKIRDVIIEKNAIELENIDTISLYLNPKHQVTYYDYILDLNPRRVIFNPGTENNELKKILDENNILYEEACTLVLLSTKQF